LQRKKKQQKRKKLVEGDGLLKLPQLRKSKVDAYGDFFLMIPTSCLGNPSERRARISHSSNKPDDD